MRRHRHRSRLTLPQIATTPSDHPSPRYRRAGQGVLEVLLLLTAILVGLLIALRPFSESVEKSVETSGDVIQDASRRFRVASLADLDRFAQREQEAPGGPAGVGSGMTGGGGLPPGSTGGLGGGGTGGGTGGGGPSGGSPGSGVGGGFPPLTGGGTGFTPPAGQSLPPAAQQALLDAAKALAIQSGLTFQLFDFATGQVVTRPVAQVINNLAQRGIPLLVGALAGALAAVEFAINADGTFHRAAPVSMVFDPTFLASATKEEVAAVLAHEAWHVEQLFNGIHDDFTNYPRVVDIEYEAFVVGATVWNAVRGTQSDPTLDAGSAAVAQGEARAKELLVTDFGYPTGPRRVG